MKIKFILWLMSTRAYKFFLKYIIPNITFFTAPGPNYYFKSRVKDRMRPGDVFLSKSSGHLTNVLIGGDFSHAGMCIGEDKIAEMTANGFDVVSVEKFCKQTTRVCIMRLNPEDENYGKLMAEKVMTFQEADYDIDFTLGLESLYCSELCYQADFEKRFKCDLSDLAGLGRPYISPVGLYQAKGLNLFMSWADKSLAKNYK